MTLQYETTDATEAQLHAAAIRAMKAEAARIKARLCADRGLPPSTGCSLPGAALAALPAGASASVGYFLVESDDTEGGCGL